MTEESKHAADLTLDDLKTERYKEGSVSDDKWKLFERRFDYAWKYFEHHAKQRYTAFNFSIVFVGILAGAYGTLYKEEEFVIATFIAGIAAAITFIFLILDQRNRQLVDVAEDILRALEMDVLFKEYKGTGRTEQLKDLGILSHRPKFSPFSHSIWMLFLQLLIILCFVGAGYHANEVSQLPDEREGRGMILSCQPGEDGVVATCKLTPEEPKADPLVNQ